MFDIACPYVVSSVSCSYYCSAETHGKSLSHSTLYTRRMIKRKISYRVYSSSIAAACLPGVPIYIIRADVICVLLLSDKYLKLL